MTWYEHFAVAVCVLLIIDGSVCLIFHEKIEGWIKKYFPELNIFFVASLEMTIAIIALFFLLKL